MLKLGQSLIAMGQIKEGCMTLGALNAKYSERVESRRGPGGRRAQSLLPLTRRSLRRWRVWARRGREPSPCPAAGISNT